MAADKRYSFGGESPQPRRLKTPKIANAVRSDRRKLQTIVEFFNAIDRMRTFNARMATDLIVI
jgi:hypothetical protein